MRIIGLDPGLRHTGWGIIELKNNRLLHIDDGRISPSTNLDEGDRLLIIRNKLKEIVDNYLVNNIDYYSRNIYQIIESGKSFVELSKQSGIDYYHLYNSYQSVKKELKKQLDL